MKLALDSKTYRRVRWGMCAALGVVAATPAAIHVVGRADATTQSAVREVRALERRAITAPGRIQPRDGVITLAAPAVAAGVAIVAELRVREGEHVERDQVLAVLNGRDELAAALVADERRVAVMQAKLTALLSAGKREDVRALEAEIAADEANLEQIAADTRRTRQLHEEHVMSAAALEAQQARWSVAARTLDAKRARLESLSSARPADVAVATAEVAAAQADVAAARAKLDTQFVRAPSAGRVLRIHAYPGQAVAADGVLAFAQTDEMFVDAEVMEHDIPRASIGQRVRITGDALVTPLQGTVERIGQIVGAREVFALDPTAFADSRVVHVLIRLSDASRTEGLINARVTVEIES